MAITIDEVRSNVRQLSPQDQQVLAYEILDSLEADDIENDPELMAEIVRRSDEVREGKVVSLSMEEHLANVRRALEQSRP
jgi:putative addiction module component (TIGR02574 family)